MLTFNEPKPDGKNKTLTTYDHILMRGVHRVDNGNLKHVNIKY